MQLVSNKEIDHSILRKGINFIFSLCILVFSCQENKIEMSDAEAANFQNKELIHDVVIYYSDSGNVIVKIVSPELVRYTKLNQQKEEFTKGLVCYFINKQDSSDQSKLSSKYAIRDAFTRLTTLQDSVVFINGKGETMRSSELIWDEPGRKLYTDKFVRITRKEELIQGYGFESDERFSYSTMKYIDAQIPAAKLFKEEKE